MNREPSAMFQYRWLKGAGDPSRAPVPVISAFAFAARFRTTAVTVAVAAPTTAGAKRTVTVHVFPGPRLVPVHVSAVTVNAGDPDTVTVIALLPRPPVLVNRSCC